MPATRVPSATYRIQLNAGLRLSDALRILDYLQQLGVSDLYLSPVLASRKGSNHGYDVIDPNRINPDLGTEEEFTALQNELQNRGMGLLLDIVPNHMAASAENPWWMDVLENGPNSAFAGFFDVEWHPRVRSMDGRILLPVLGRPFGEALDSGELKLVYSDGRFFIQYFESLFPLAPHSYHGILNHRAERLKDSLEEDSPAYQEYFGIVASALDLARADRRAGETAAERRLRFESIRDRLRTLVSGNPGVARLIEGNLSEINGKEGDPASFGVLQRLLAEQHYNLAFWQNLNESINYRRFFTIADLVGVRVEDPLVFEASHGYILRLVARNPLAGLRVDHIDGLRDPLAYLTRLQERLANDETHSETPSYVLVEKILELHEDLPADWPVSGTTGYDYVNIANGIFVDPEGADEITETYSEFIGRKQDFYDVLYQKKKLVMNRLLGVEMRTLGRYLAELAAQDRYARELDRGRLIEALIEVTACLPVYRTYIRNMDLPARALDYIEKAVTDARGRVPQLQSVYFDFVREVLLLLNPAHVLPDQRETRLAFITRWQQFTGPIHAKGFEDTALYVYYPLLSLNEVGGDPRPSDAASREEFYAFLAHRQQHWPTTLNATSTHDTKRSEDVRARINVLSEIPSDWREHLSRWSALNARHKRQIGAQPTPDKNEEYFFYQTLLGLWPLEAAGQSNLLERVQAHMIKATREAMVHTRWTRPNQPHEEALQDFSAKVLGCDNREFLDDFLAFQSKIAYFGMINSLSQVLLKVVSPGVADFYQGSELWDLRLVDPDNRGPVDFARRSDALKEICRIHSDRSAGSVRDLVDHWQDGRVKLYLIWKALAFRRGHHDLFASGQFLPLRTTGCYSKNVIAFLRKTPALTALAAVPRWLSQVPERPNKTFDWCDTRLELPPNAPSKWTNELTSGQIATASREGVTSIMVEDLFCDFPAALLYG